MLAFEIITYAYYDKYSHKFPDGMETRNYPDDHKLKFLFNTYVQQDLESSLFTRDEQTPKFNFTVFIGFVVIVCWCRFFVTI